MRRETTIIRLTGSEKYADTSINEISSLVRGAYICLLLGDGQIVLFQKGIFGFALDVVLGFYGAPFYIGEKGFLINFGKGYCGFFTQGSGFLCWIAFLLFATGLCSAGRAILKVLTTEQSQDSVE